MIYFIDGPQQVGKTTLIEGLKTIGMKAFKFPFGSISKEFNLTSNEAIKGLQIGKDLSGLYFIKSLVEEGTEALIDRGPLSTLYYSILKNRMTPEEITNFAMKVGEYGKDHTYIFMVPKNRGDLASRVKGDGFDDKGLEAVSWEAVCELYNLCQKAGLKFIILENDFARSIEENIAKLAGMIRRGKGVNGVKD